MRLSFIDGSRFDTDTEVPRAACAVRLLAINALALLVACVTTADAAPEAVAVDVTGVPSGPVAGGTLVTLRVTATDDAGAPVAGVVVELVDPSGGGALASTRGITDDAGQASFDWTLGVMPVRNALVVDAGPSFDVIPVAVEVEASSSSTPAGFGDVEGFMAANDRRGSTEDLAFGPDGGLVMGIPGGLLTLDAAGSVRWLETTGDVLDRPLGLAFDGQGRLWVADVAAEALIRVDRAGVVTTIADRAGDTPFAGPNDVAVLPDGHVYLSDPCLGAVFAFDPDGIALSRLDLADAQGGPNGVVVGPDQALWLTTGNTSLFCPKDGIGFLEAVAGLIRVPLLDDGTFGAPETIASKVATFGDGLTFDAEGNLYAIFDTVAETFDASIVFVLPAGQRTLRPAITSHDRIWSNLAFGTGTFGATTLYLALLGVPVFSEVRGVERIPVGIAGAPLPGG